MFFLDHHSSHLFKNIFVFCFLSARFFFIVCEPRALFVCPHALSGTVQWLILLERETREIKFNALCMIFVDMNENGRQNLHVYGHPISVGFC